MGGRVKSVVKVVKPSGSTFTLDTNKRRGIEKAGPDEEILIGAGGDSAE
jgi:hypothetical protein